jgi:hypothetical protein
MLRGELRDLDKELASASEKAGDRETRLHVEGIRAQIKEIWSRRSSQPLISDRRPSDWQSV